MNLIITSFFASACNNEFACIIQEDNSGKMHDIYNYFKAILDHIAMSTIGSLYMHV